MLRAFQVLLAGCALLLAPACARNTPAPPLHADLLQLFPLTSAARERGTIDLGTPDGDALLRGGWAHGATLDDGTTVAIAIERKAKLRFTIREPAPRQLRVDALQLASAVSAADRRAGTPVLLELNGHRLGKIEIGAELAPIELDVPVAAQRAGDNLLKLDHPTMGARVMLDDAAARPRNAIAYDRIEIRALRAGAAAAPHLAEAPGGTQALLLAAGTTVDYFVRPPGAAELRLAYRREDASVAATLQVLLRGESDAAPTTIDLPAGNAVAATTLPLDATPGDVVGIGLRASGAAVRIEQAAIHAAPLQPVQPARSVAATARHAAGEHPPNVLLYVIDTLRADHLGCYGYDRPTSPRIDELALGGVTFTRALAQAPWTRPSVASILTGLEPLVHGASSLRRKLRPDVATLAELLRAQGYATAAFVTNANVAGSLGFERGFDAFVDLPEDHARPSLHVPSRELNVPVRAWLARNGARPFFLYVHASDPHAPYTPDPEILARFLSGGEHATPPDIAALRAARVAPAEGSPPATDPSAFPPDRLAALTAAYDAEIAANDASFGALLDHLHEIGADDRTLVVLTSDHGEELGDHGDLEHGHSLHEELLHVPLIVRLPDGRLAGERHTVLAQHVDVLPTVLEVVGAPVPSGLPGRPLLARDEPPDPSREVRSHTDFGPWELMSLATARWKAVEAIDAPRGRHGVAVYDVVADPRERHDVATQHDAVVGYARQSLEAVRREGSARAGDAPVIDPATAARLRALGYAD